MWRLLRRIIYAGYSRNFYTYNQHIFDSRWLPCCYLLQGDGVLGTSGVGTGVSGVESGVLEVVEVNNRVL